MNRLIIIAGSSLLILAFFLPATVGITTLSVSGSCGSSGTFYVQPQGTGYAASFPFTTPCGTFNLSSQVGYSVGPYGTIGYTAGSNTFSVPSTFNGIPFACWSITNIAPYTSTPVTSILANAGNPSITLNVPTVSFIPYNGQNYQTPGSINPVYSSNPCAGAIVISSPSTMPNLALNLGELIGGLTIGLGVIIPSKKAS